MVRAKEIEKWFAEHIKDGDKPYLLDKYQAKVIGDTRSNILVTARAGSGKTRTLVAKIVYLLAHEDIAPEEIIAFAFNKKAREEVNERLAHISYDGVPLFDKTPAIASTFHAFAYETLGGRKVVGRKLISEGFERRIITEILKKEFPNSAKMSKADFYAKVDTAQQFITRAEQKFFVDYKILDELVETKLKKATKSSHEQLETAQALFVLNKVLKKYQARLKREGLTNFNQMVAHAAEKLKGQTTPYKFILVDEYQDFSLLFLTMIRALRRTCPSAHLLCVGDDWQAINRFAGSDVEFFLHFSKYFPNDNAKLFIPTNYRSGKRIVKNANYFMSRALKDYKGCKSGNKKTKAKIFVRNIDYGTESSSDLPLLLENYLKTCLKIIKENPGKSVMILHRNNEMSFRGWSIDRFVEQLRESAVKNHLLSRKKAEELITGSTVHRSKGLESDVVVLLEIDAEKFPGKDKTHGLYSIFGENEKNLFTDECRLFYVALTRPKERLYILSKTTLVIKNNKNKSKAKLNFFSYLNDNWLIDF